MTTGSGNGIHNLALESKIQCRELHQIRLQACNLNLLHPQANLSQDPLWRTWWSITPVPATAMSKRYSCLELAQRFPSHTQLAIQRNLQLHSITNTEKLAVVLTRQFIMCRLRAILDVDWKIHPNPLQHWMWIGKSIPIRYNTSGLR